MGGVEELTSRLAANLVQRGNQVEVWTFRHPPTFPSTELVGGITVRRFEFPVPRSQGASVAGFPGQARAAFGEMSRAIRSFRPDVLHVQCFSTQGIYATVLASRHRIPLVVTLQGETVMDDNDIYQHSTVLRLGLRAALRRAKAVTGCSAFVIADAVDRFGLPPAKGRVIYNGVEMSGDGPHRPVNLPFERFVLGMGRVVPKKGFDLLIKAFSQLAGDHPDVGLVIGGDGRARRALLDQAATAGLSDRVVLTGSLDRAEVAWVMADAEVFVLPSRVEPFGIVVLEALRAERPVVVSSRGGAPEIVQDGRDGLVADPFDTHALAVAISRLLQDRALARTLAAAGQRRAEDFAWPKITEQYLEIYRSVH